MKAEKIHFESLSPNMIAGNVNKTVEYYTNVLGFHLVASVPLEGRFNWAMTNRDGVTIMFQSLKSLKEDLPTLKITRKGSVGTFFIKMKCVDEFYQKIRKKVKIASRMRTTFYGMREFTIKDINGYFLTFAEDVKAN